MTICPVCGQSILTPSYEKDAADVAEFRARHGRDPDPSLGDQVVCDDCYQRLINMEEKAKLNLQ